MDFIIIIINVKCEKYDIFGSYKFSIDTADFSPIPAYEIYFIYLQKYVSNRKKYRRQIAMIYTK